MKQNKQNRNYLLLITVLCFGILTAVSIYELIRDCTEPGIGSRRLGVDIPMVFSMVLITGGLIKKQYGFTLCRLGAGFGLMMETCKLLYRDLRVGRDVLDREVVFFACLLLIFFIRNRAVLLAYLGVLLKTVLVVIAYATGRQTGGAGAFFLEILSELPFMLLTVLTGYTVEKAIKKEESVLTHRKQSGNKKLNLLMKAGFIIMTVVYAVMSALAAIESVKTGFPDEAFFGSFVSMGLCFITVLYIDSDTIPNGALGMLLLCFFQSLLSQHPADGRALAEAFRRNVPLFLCLALIFESRKWGVVMGYLGAFMKIAFIIIENVTAAQSGWFGHMLTDLLVALPIMLLCVVTGYAERCIYAGEKAHGDDGEDDDDFRHTAEDARENTDTENDENEDIYIGRRLIRRMMEAGDIPPGDEMAYLKKEGENRYMTPLEIVEKYDIPLGYLVELRQSILREFGKDPSSEE